ncbi:MAG: folate-binding protein YgfZ [Alphaproteobacteria bacterium]|nr:folate-binding protein YgfZ [Alphaproteobacteria bacterium]
MDNRGVLRLKGAESLSFLQGLVTNDVKQAQAGKAVYAAMLTPQGKFMFDMIVFADGDDLLLDVEAARKPDLMRRLMMYKLRADVEITDETGLFVFASFKEPQIDAVFAVDPRHPDLGWRVIAAENAASATLDATDYEIARLKLGVPDGSRDMIPEKYFWLETAAEKLNGVSFSKGCYVGQELTARMKHRTTLKKMLVPVKVSGLAPEAGTMITSEDGKTAGEIRTSAGEFALAYLRLEYAETPLACGGSQVRLI